MKLQEVLPRLPQHHHSIIVARRVAAHLTDALPYDSPEGMALDRILANRDTLAPKIRAVLDAIDAEYDDLERVVFDSLQSPT